MNIIERKISDLIPADYNPRELTKKQKTDLRKSLTDFGFVNPILVNVNEARKNIVIGGHQRLKIWEELGNKKVPCVEVDLSFEKEKELNIRLNRNNGQWDMDLLSANFSEKDLLDWGFETEDLLKAFGDEEKEEEDGEVKFSEFLNESNNYVVLFFDNDIDWLQAQTHFNLETKTAMRANGKPWSKGIGRVIRGAEYLKGITSNA